MKIKHLVNWKRNRRRWLAFVHDLLMIPIAWLGSFWFRFNLEQIPTDSLNAALTNLPLIFAVQGAGFWYFGLYRGIWRFASIPDLARIVKAVVAGVAVAAVAMFLWNRLEGVPRTVFVLDAGILGLLLGGPRVLYRWIKDRHLYLRDGQRALIVGAGRAGEMLVRDLLRGSDTPYQPVGFVDDDPGKHGMDMHGIEVFGPCERIPDLAEKLEADLVLIALPSADAHALRRIVDICEKASLPFRALPPLQDLVSGQTSVKQLRDVSIDDLLGRAKVTLDWEGIRYGLIGRAVMVTGGGGSIGSELCRQIARIAPNVLVILEANEFNLYQIDLELRREYPNLPIACVLGDVGDPAAVTEALEKYQPAVIFHAAAYKHVPMLESQVRAAIRNNVLGTHTLAKLAVEHNVPSFVLISTDKAVNPTNVMGASKRLAEIICLNLNGLSRTQFVTVRFGNVLGSAGSVVPLFRKQIASGGPVTVTHPLIERFFMTIPEACQLILQAHVIGNGGEIFVLDMGEPIKINYLAEQLIRLSGKKPGEDIEIVYTGLRPGEKLREELFYQEEKLNNTNHPKIMKASSAYVDGARVLELLGDLEDTVRQRDDQRSLALLRVLVPEYRTEGEEELSRNSDESSVGKIVQAGGTYPES